MTETEQYDVPEVLAALEAAVAKRGEDYVYENPAGERANPDYAIGCSYTHFDPETEQGTPGCIVGLVYFNLTGAVVPPDLNSTTIDNEYGSPARIFTPGAIDILAAAQRRQDNGAPWSRALAAAKQRAAEV